MCIGRSPALYGALGPGAQRADGFAQHPGWRLRVHPGPAGQPPGAGRPGRDCEPRVAAAANPGHRPLRQVQVPP
eukprot:11188624-Lingulodinium_polyedra.AAC.1